MPISQTETLLLVEDDVELAVLTQNRLEKEGFTVLHETDGRSACDRIAQNMPDLVVLDLMLPGMDGFGVCRTVRQFYQGPILILTARDDDMDEILGLELGADDYVTKPVRPRVLIAHIRALLRRVQTDLTKPIGKRITLGDLIVDVSRREVILQGLKVEFTTVEFDLLWHLVSQAGEVVSRQDIYQALFHYDYDGTDRSVDVYISRIRQKLGDDSAAAHYIKTVRGVGYLMAGNVL
ncbi:MAG: response regulator transcription factor [Candidatus Latescibacteria bacterium]|nr:response regulator transcription factor [Candidatus Latescibacterota bacterium]